MKAVLALLLIATAVPAQAAFNPVEFFRGKTHGSGTLKVIFSSPKVIEVDNEGLEEKDGSVVLKQVIHEPGKPARVRFWRLKEVAKNRYEGTLTDAASAVRVDVTDKGVRIRFHGKDHLDFDQVLEPAGPREVHNHMKVKRFGITVAHFEEVIRKLD